jgi:multiple sugar transport system substrate-binding protein
MAKKAAILILSLAVLVCGVYAQKQVKLVIAGRDGDYGNAMQVAVDAYMAKNPNVSFDLLKLSGDDVYQKTVIDLKSGTGTYDLILIDDPKAMQYQQAGWLEDLDAMYKKSGKAVDADFISTTMDLCRFPNGSKGKLYSLPFVGNVSLFAYRTDLFAKYGLPAPKTWNDVLAAAKKISESDPSVSGVSFRGVKGNPILTAFLPIFWSFGADFFDASGKPIVNSPEAVRALKFFLELAKYGPKSAPMNNTAQIRDGLLAGTVGIAPEVWPAWLGSLDDPNQSKVAGKVKVTKHPADVKKSSPMIGIWHAAIPASSKNKQAAFDFLTFLTSKETQKLMVLKAGLPPSRKSVFEDKEILAKYPWYPAILEALEDGVARPRTLYWAEIENTMGGLIQEALIGSKTAEQALGESNAKIAEIVNQ